jgi:protein SCO1/2
MVGTAKTDRWRRAAQAGASIACALFACDAPAQFAQNDLPEPARGLDIVEHLGEAVPLEASLVNSRGEPVHLGDLFNKGKPVVLALAYYDCPVACPAVLDAMTRSFNGFDYTVGSDFNVAVVSFNPQNTTLMAAEAKELALGAYDRPKTDEIRSGWQFYTASAEASKSIADAVGFTYRLLPSGDYSHPIGVFVLTPQGKISRYFYGFDYPAKDMKLSLISAAEGQMSLTLGDRLLLFCYHYDPKTGTLTLLAYRLMQAGAIVTLVLLAALVALLRGAEKRRGRRAASRPASLPEFPVNAPTAALGPTVATQR